MTDVLPLNHATDGDSEEHIHVYFWATICKTVCPMLSVRCLSVCDVYVVLFCMRLLAV